MKSLNPHLIEKPGQKLTAFQSIVRNNSSDGSQYLKLLAFAVLMGMITTGCWPIAWLQYESGIVITATGTANPQSRSSEVWVLAFGGVDAARLIQQGVYGDGWRVRNRVMVSYELQPATVRWHNKLNDDFKVVLGRHPYSGHAKVTWNGVERSFDLFDDSDRGPLSLSASDFRGGKREVPFFRTLRENAILFFAFVSIYLFLIFLLLHPRGQKSGLQDQPLALGSAVLLALPSVVVYLIVLFALWPAQMSPDSVGIWHELKTGKIGDAMSAFHTYLALISTKLYDSPAALVFLNILCIVCPFILILRELPRWGVSRKGLLVFSVAFPLFPANFFLITTIWKDVVYTAGFMLISYCFLVLLRTRANRVPASLCISLFTGLLVISLSRHNGLLVAPAVVVVLLASVARCKSFRSLAVTSLAAIVTVVAVKAILYPAVTTGGLPVRYNAIVPIHIIGAYVKTAPELVEDDRSLYRIIPRSEWVKSYDCQTVGPLFWNKSIDYSELEQNYKDIQLLSINLIRKSPLIFFKHQLCVTSFLWKINSTSDLLLTVPMEIVSIPLSTKWGLKSESQLPTVRDQLQRLKIWTEKPSLRPLFWGTALALFVPIFLSGLFVIVRRDWRYLLLCCLPVFNALSLAPLVGSPDYRYQYPAVVVMLLLIPISFVIMRSSDSSG